MRASFHIHKLYDKVCEIKCKRFAYDFLEGVIFNHNGIIYGEYVRDKFIREYYTNEYYKGAVIHNDHKYWNKKYSPDTQARLIVPDDIAVCFPNAEDAKKFIEYIPTVKEFSKMSIMDLTKDYYEETRQMMDKHRITITMQLGYIPFISQGKELHLYIDVMVPFNEQLQPPFYNLDMLCNGFIMTKDGKTYSKHTGTIIDSYGDYERALTVAGILKDLVKFRTYICQTMNRFHRINIDIFKNIEKMHKKNRNYVFLNLPLTIEINNDMAKQEVCCYICLNNFKLNQKIFCSRYYQNEKEMKGCRMHFNCCMNHLKNQSKDVGNKLFTSNFVFKCPFSIEIDFSSCLTEYHNAYIV